MPRISKQLREAAYGPALKQERLQLIRVNSPFNRFDRDVALIDYNHGDTLLDLRNKHFPQEVPVVVSLNGKAVPQESLALYYPVDGDQLLFVPEIQGGGGGGKDILRTVAMIVVAAAAIWVSGGALAPYLGSAFGAGTFGAAMAGVAVGIGGAMLVNSILPPPKPKLPTMSDMDASQVYGWNPQTTQSQGGVIPKFYGKNKLYGNIIASDVEVVSDKIYLNALISLGIGPYKAVGILGDGSDTFKINDQPISQLKGVEKYVRLGHIDQTPVENFNDTKTEYPLSMKVVNGTPYTYSTIGNNFDGLEVEITFPQGLWYANAGGGLDVVSVDVKIEIKKQGDAVWSPITESYSQSQSEPYNGRWSIGYWVYDTYDESGNGIGDPKWREKENPNSTDPYAYVEGNRYGGRIAHWINGSLQTAIDNIDYVRVSGNQTSPIKRVFSVRDLPAGTYDVKITNLSADHTETRYGDDLYLTKVAEVVYDDFTYPRHVLVGVRALATDQLSGSLRFSCMAECALIRVYNGTSWSVAYNNNPAWVCYDILTQPVFDNSLNVVRYDGINPSRIDHVKFKEWADFCDTLVPDGKGGTEKRITFNGGFDSDTSMWEAALQVCQVGRAGLIWNGMKLTVAIDKATTPSWLVSVGNMGVDSFRENFLPMEDRATEIEIDFINSENDYNRDKFTVFSPSATTAKKVNLQLFGVNKPSEAWRAGKYRLAQNQYITRTIEFEADIDSIACTIGDVINVQHDVPQWGFGGRIVSATSNTVTIDKEVTITAGKTYALMVRLANDTLVEKTVTNTAGTYTVLTVSSPFTSIPVQYDLYAFGETNKVVKPFRVIGISRTQEQKATITGVEYNSSIYTIDDGQPALPTPNYSSLNPFPSVTDIVLDELLIAGKDGSLNDVIDIYFKRPSDSAYKYAEVWYNIGGGWVYVADADAESYRLNNAEVNRNYKIAIVTVNALGQKQPIQNAPKASVTTLGKLKEPNDVTGFTTSTEALGIKLKWDHIPDADLWAYEIRVGESWAAGTIVTSGISKDSYFWAVPQGTSGLVKFWVKAIDTSGIYSTNVTMASLTISPSGAVTSFTQQVVDNNVLLRWAGNPGTFPIDRYEIRKGDVYSAAQVVGFVSGTFSAIFEMQSGTYKYWVTAIDTAGLYGTSNSLTATVSQPPDFQLKANWDDDFTGNKTNIYQDSLGDTYACVNTFETCEQHFTNNGKNTIQDFVDAGYTYVTQPVLATASYERTFDYGSQIPGTMISMSLDKTFLMGTLTITPKISISTDNIAWTDYNGVWQVFANNFRYVKARLDFSGTGENIAALNNLNLTLSVKLQNDGGNDTVSTASTGKAVLFTKTFIDVDSITVTAKGTTTPKIAIYDFTDAPNPTQFTVYLYDLSGVKVTGDFSWSAKGY